MNFYYKEITSPVGAVTLIADESALVSLLWENQSQHKEKFKCQSSIDHPVIRLTEIQLLEYFKGLRTQFDLPLNPQGTDFQKRVWKELTNIPFGQTITYGEQARRLGQPNSARAVGAANGKNPLGLIVPCHRVVGTSGSLTGFSGGLDIKRKLLDLEKQKVC